MDTTIYSFDKTAYIKWVSGQLQIDPMGVHGFSHWGRVYNIGQHLGKLENARLDVLELFAFLHDHCRMHENHDVVHGSLAAESALWLRNRFFQIDDSGFDDLITAMMYHSDGTTQGNINVQCCWDSDRLDLFRVGKMPNEKYLCTKSAKNPIFIEQCVQQSRDWLSRFFIQHMQRRFV